MRRQTADAHDSLNSNDRHGLVVCRQTDNVVPETAATESPRGQAESAGDVAHAESAVVGVMVTRKHGDKELEAAAGRADALHEQGWNLMSLSDSFSSAMKLGERVWGGARDDRPGARETVEGAAGVCKDEGNERERAIPRLDLSAVAGWGVFTGRGGVTGNATGAAVPGGGVAGGGRWGSLGEAVSSNADARGGDCSRPGAGRRSLEDGHGGVGMVQAIKARVEMAISGEAVAEAHRRERAAGGGARGCGPAALEEETRGREGGRGWAGGEGEGMGEGGVQDGKREKKTWTDAGGPGEDQMHRSSGAPSASPRPRSKGRGLAGKVRAAAEAAEGAPEGAATAGAATRAAAAGAGQQEAPPAAEPGGGTGRGAPQAGRAAGMPDATGSGVERGEPASEPAARSPSAGTGKTSARAAAAKPPAGARKKEKKRGKEQGRGEGGGQEEPERGRAVSSLPPAHSSGARFSAIAAKSAASRARGASPAASRVGGNGRNGFDTGGGNAGARAAWWPSPGTSAAASPSSTPRSSVDGRGRGAAAAGGRAAAEAVAVEAAAASAGSRGGAGSGVLGEMASLEASVVAPRAVVVALPLSPKASGIYIYIYLYR